MNRYYIFYSDLEKTIIGFNYGPALKDNYLIINSNELGLFEEIFSIDNKTSNELKKELKEKFKYKPTVFFNKIKTINTFIENINKNNNKRIPIMHTGELKEINDKEKNMIDYEVIDFQANRLCIRLKKLPFQIENNGDRDIIIGKMLNILDIENKKMEDYLIKILYSNTSKLTFEDIKKAFNKTEKKESIPTKNKTQITKETVKTKPKTMVRKKINNYGYSNIIFLAVVLVSSIIFAINMAYILVK